MWGVSATADAQSVSEMNARVEAERAGRPFLLYRDGHDRQQLLFFTPEATQASVGRRPPADLLLDWDEQVSRLHARFERVGDDWELIDDGLSRNGTFLNEERLSGRRRLSDGDTLRFGATTVTFRSPQSAQPASAGAGRGRGPHPGCGGPLEHTAPRPHGTVPSIQGGGPVRQPGHRPGDRG